MHSIYVKMQLEKKWSNICLLDLQYFSKYPSSHVYAHLLYTLSE